MRALLLIPAVLAACAAPQQPGTPPPVKAVYTVDALPEGLIRVTGPAKDEDDLAPHHCSAAKLARAQGEGVMEWVGGVAEPREVGFQAQMEYRTGGDAGEARAEDPEAGGPTLISAWLPFCDEAGMSRDGAA